MNKDEIKKALEFCADIDYCDDCPYDVVRNCSDRLKLDARELITEQEEEINKLKAENARLKEKLKQVLLAVDTVKEMNAMCDIDEQNAEIERLKAENADLLKACEEQFTFDTTENRTYSIFNSVRKEFAEKLWNTIKDKGIDYKIGLRALGEEIDELLKEYEE